MAAIRLPVLPIGAVLDELALALGTGRAAVLEAPPGAGKSTVVPLALLGSGWLDGRRIVMLEPRRLAARAVATRMATTLGEAVGERIGYRMRLDTRISRATRIEVVTEGILARLLQDDPALEGIGLVIFDEFHERSLAADLGLALVLDAQKNLRPDLRVLVMSATLDGEAVARLLGDARRITSAGRAHPVEVRHARRVPEYLERELANTVCRALNDEPGDALVFLPGAAEIRRLERALAAAELPRGTNVLPLYGELAADAQDKALLPSAPGQRKVVLATSIAETSLTIEGVRIVIDSGLSRRSRFDPASGMSRLETLPVSLASAEQRRGRAGRLEPGVCYRLYTEAAERALAAAAPAEILETDLAPLALDLACWGTEASALAWLDPPPPAHLAQGRELLTELGALDALGRATDAGRRMAELGLHPRLARMLLAATGPARQTAAELAALLSERDIARQPPQQRDADLGKRLELLHGRALPGLEADRGATERVRRLAALWQRTAGASLADAKVSTADPGALLALAYPDRIAQRRGDSARYLLSSGRGAAFAGPDALTQHEYLVVAMLDGAGREARIQLAVAVSREALEALFADRIIVSERIEWQRRESAVAARRECRLGALVLEETLLSAPDPERTVAAMLEGVRELGLEALPWTRAAAGLRERIAFLRRHAPAAGWPDLGNEALTAALEDWLGPYLPGITRRDHLARLDLAAIFRAQLDHRQWLALERDAPTELTVPSGSRVAIDYSGAHPMVAVRLQEMFGLTTTPTVGGGVALTIELLSPARRPVQVTRDLASFWARGYAEVRKELKGRYPKHYWPDDPLIAQPTARAKPRR